jgi:hypothetical protein
MVLRRSYQTWRIAVAAGCFLVRGFALLCRHSAVLVCHSPLSQIRMEYWCPQATASDSGLFRPQSLTWLITSTSG